MLSPRRPTLVSRILCGVLLATGVAACTEESRNPLSPNVAGPMEGVAVSSPAPVSPADGALIPVTDQPVRLVFANGQTNGERPVFFNVRLARDAAFEAVVHEATGIPADGSGQTSYRLPEGLDAGQMYYWDAQTDDGANASAPSAAGRFEIYAPPTISAPRIDTRGSGETASTLVISGGAVEGPAEDPEYEIEIARDPEFTDVVARRTGPLADGGATVDLTSLVGAASAARAGSEASRSAAATERLQGDTTYYWRARVSARGRAGRVEGPWSARGRFKTPPAASDLTAPTPSRPVGGVTIDTVTPDLVVENPQVPAVFHPVTLRVQLSRDSAFSEVEATVTAPMASGPTTILAAPSLAPDLRYYWRARAEGGGVRGAWSAVRNFRTPAPNMGGGPTPPPPPPGGGGDPPPSPPSPPPSPSGGGRDELDLSRVTWLHHDVSGWPRTSRITSVSIGDPPICIEHTKSGRWPTIRIGGGTVVEGNPWIFVQRNGRWYGATYEWLRPGQTCKGISAGNIGAHIKEPPLNTWRPRRGERVGLMVSTPARFGPEGSRQERSNVVMTTWP